MRGARLIASFAAQSSRALNTGRACAQQLSKQSIANYTKNAQAATSWGAAASFQGPSIPQFASMPSAWQTFASSAVQQSSATEAGSSSATEGSGEGGDEMQGTSSGGKKTLGYGEDEESVRNSERNRTDPPNIHKLSYDGLSAKCEELTAKAEGLSQQVEQHQQEAEGYKDRLIRSLADMENLRDRTQKQMQESKKFAVQGIARDFLDVADNLDRAAQSVPDNVSSSDAVNSEDVTKEIALKNLHGLLEGVRATQSILNQVLSKNGIEKYDPMGHVFDPNKHNAMFRIPVEDASQLNTIAHVSKTGYTIHDRVLRAAEVGVRVAKQ